MKENGWIALTMGDPAGVGPELCVRALAEPAVAASCRLMVLGSMEVLQRASEIIRVPLPPLLPVLRPEEPNPQTANLCVVDVATPPAGEFAIGQISASCGQAAYKYIELSIRYALESRVDAVVTAPLHKASLSLSGVKHPGHTEIFTALTGSKRTCMMLHSEQLSVSMVTTHIGYGEVPARMTAQRICDVIELTSGALERLRGTRPRIGVCGLNPHSGEQGLFGRREEELLIEPAIKAARENGIDASGPLSPDAAFTDQTRKRFDGIVCMYHDQGHIPFKMLAFDDGVNITLGLPIVRTSVDHGTAFDIAWQGIARPTSLFKALEYAIALSRKEQAQTLHCCDRR